MKELEKELQQEAEYAAPVAETSKSEQARKEEDDFEGCIVPLINFMAIPYATLYPLFWVPFAFTAIGFPVYSLYVWPFCVLAWLLSLIVAHRYLKGRPFDYYIAVSTLLCVLVETVLTFYLSYPDL